MPSQWTSNPCLKDFSLNLSQVTEIAACAINTDIKFLPILIAAIVAILSLTVAIVAILVNRYMAQVKNSSDFEGKIESDKRYYFFYQKLKQFKEDESNTGTPVNWNSISEDNSDLRYKTIIALLNPWESAANGVENGIYNDYVLYNMYGSELISIFNFSKEFVVTRRELMNNPRLFEKVEWLYCKWKARHNLKGLFNKK